MKTKNDDALNWVRKYGVYDCDGKRMPSQGQDAIRQALEAKDSKGVDFDQFGNNPQIGFDLTPEQIEVLEKFIKGELTIEAQTVDVERPEAVEEYFDLHERSLEENSFIDRGATSQRSRIRTAVIEYIRLLEKNESTPSETVDLDDYRVSTPDMGERTPADGKNDLITVLQGQYAGKTITIKD